ncbi:hypothetical protein V6U90_30670 [Micromonospora sp. CPCC 206060]
MATAEITRSQVWQWIRHLVRLVDGRVVDHALVDDLVRTATSALLCRSGYPSRTVAEATQLFRRVTLDVEFVELLTIPGVRLLPTGSSVDFGRRRARADAERFIPGVAPGGPYHARQFVQPGPLDQPVCCRSDELSAPVRD